MILVQTIGVFAALMSVIGVVLAASKAKRPLLRALGSAVCGAASLGAVNLLAGYTGVSIALNYATAFVAVVLGAPGVVTMLLLRVLLLFLTSVGYNIPQRRRMPRRGGRNKIDAAL